MLPSPPPVKRRASQLQGVCCFCHARPAEACEDMRATLLRLELKRHLPIDPVVTAGSAR
jgi:hypothetical protein